MLTIDKLPYPCDALGTWEPGCDSSIKLQLRVSAYVYEDKTYTVQPVPLLSTPAHDERGVMPQHTPYTVGICHLFPKLVLVRLLWLIDQCRKRASGSMSSHKAWRR